MELLRILYQSNPWWIEEKIKKDFLYKITRNELNDVIEHLNEKRILTLIGPRRVGKSTLIYQTMDYLISNQVDPKRIFFLSGDDPGLFINNSIDEVLNLYYENVIMENVNNLKEKIYIFIDEIHFVENWQKYLKVFYDRKYNIKFIISGSSSSHLFHDSNESLLGRIDNLNILPLDFKQFTRFYQTYIGDMDCEIPMLSFGNIESDYKELNNYYYNDKLKLSINKIFEKYLIAGGYPEYFETSSDRMWQKKLVEDIVLRGIYRDIVSVYKVRNPMILEKLLYYIADNQSQGFSFNSISNNLSTDTVTITNYIKYLENAFFIEVLENYSSNQAKVIRSNKKMMIMDVGLRNALLRKDRIEKSELGLIIESIVNFNVRLICEKNLYKAYYYRKNREEVDLIIDTNRGVIPIEVKYKSRIDKSDLKAIRNFIMNNQSKYGIVVTENVLDNIENIYMIPFWLFMYMDNIE